MKILIAAGGTGGHVYPAIAVANEIRRRHPDSEITFVGTRNGFEATIVPEQKFPIEYIEIKGMNSKSAMSKFQSFTLLPKSFKMSNDLLKKYQPDIVFGIGGFTSGPLLLLAAFKRIHTAIMEPNAIAGFTNRWLGKFVEKVFITFDHASRYFPKNKWIHSGNPIRKEILEIGKPNFTVPKKTIFIFGGSQGASKINQSVMEMIKKDPIYWRQFSFIHQTGPHDFEKARRLYHRFKIDADVRKFFSKIYEAYEKSHFIIARSGSSVMEIAAVGRPSILIPFPYSADDHQMANAEVLSTANAAVLVRDEECNGEVLYSFLKLMFDSSDGLERMSARALTFRIENAASIIVDQFEQWTA